MKCLRFCSVLVDGKIFELAQKFDLDAKDRVIRLVEGRTLAENVSIQEACKTAAPKLGVSRHTARQWTQAARHEGCGANPVPEDLFAEVAKPHRENQELHDANELLQVTSVFRVTTRPKISVMIRFIDEYRDRFSVEFICKTLKNITGLAGLSPRVVTANPKPVGSALVAFAMLC